MAVVLGLVRGLEPALIYIEGWRDLSVTYQARVSGLDTSVDQKASNTRECIRMCWLFSACSAVTFILDHQRCLLYSTDEDVKTVFERSSLAVDLRDVKVMRERVSPARIVITPLDETIFDYNEITGFKDE